MATLEGIFVTPITIARAIDYFEATRKNWSFKNGMLVFDYDKDLATYNAIIADGRAAAAEQGRIDQAARAGLKKKGKELKEVMPR